PWMDARSLMRSACAAVAASPHTAASAARDKKRRNAGRRRYRNAAIMSERRNIQEKALQPTHGLDFVHHALASEFDSGVRHLRGRNGIRARDGTWVHDAGETQVLAAPIDGDLLVARDLEIA